MGFIKETYTNGNAGLVVSFSQKETNDNFCASDSVEEAMKHFGLYLDENNHIRINSDSDRAINALEIKPEEAKDFRSKVDTLLVALTDEQAIENIILFPTWSIGINYKVNDRIRYNNILYRVLQDHTSQADWVPSSTVSLFARVLNETEDNSIPEWIQPESTEGFKIGDQVMHNGILYTSTADNNIWEPGTVGAPWETETMDEAIEETTEIKKWENGTTYMIGDHILYEEKEYESIIDNNVWSPIDYPAGWAEITE